MLIKEMAKEELTSVHIEFIEMAKIKLTRGIMLIIEMAKIELIGGHIGFNVLI